MDNRAKLYVPLAATVAVCSLATLYWTRSKTTELNKDQRVAELLPIEQTLAGGGGGDNAMSTLTWFQGDTDEAIRLLKERARCILESNPWLAGRVKKHNGSPALLYSTDVPALEDYFHVTQDVLSRDIPLNQLGSKLSNHLLKTGPKEPLWKVAVYPCSQNPASHFAVVMTLSHVIGDGATYYAVANMLLAASPIVALNVERIQSTEEQQIQAMGGTLEYGVFSSAGFIANCVAGVLKALVSKTKYTAVSQIYLVDPEGMHEAKQEAISSAKDAPKFVSSNDVLTSWFFQNCNCNHGLMALNFRGRLKGHTDLHAGNYENAIFYRQEDSASPALIRQSISGTPWRRQATTDQPMPTFWEMVAANNAICTNWASFAKPSDLNGCATEEIQLPLYNVAALLPSSMALCLVFRAGPKGLAVFVAGSPDKLEGLKQSVPFLKQEQRVS